VPYLGYIGSKLSENTIPDFSNNVDKLLEGIENLLKIVLFVLSKSLKIV
jgi:hypothetical protein